MPETDTAGTKRGAATAPTQSPPQSPPRRDPPSKGTDAPREQDAMWRMGEGGSDPLPAYERSGLLVFRVASIATILFIFFSVIMALLNVDTPYVMVLRNIQFLLTLCAISLILVFLSRNRTIFSISLSVFVMGALIVPTNDIIRFIILFSGSEKKFSELYSGDVSTTNRFDRSAEIASAIMSKLDFRGLSLIYKKDLDKIADFKEQQPDIVLSASRIVQETIADGLNKQLTEAVKQRGADRLLRAIANNQVREYTYRYSAQERFRNDLSYLRSEGLISFVYDDIDSVEPTKQGWDIARLLRSEQDARADGRSALQQAGGSPLSLTTGARLPSARVFAGAFRMPSSEQDVDRIKTSARDVTSAVRQSLTAPAIPASIQVPPEGVWIKFTLSEVGEYQIDVESDRRSAVDPIVYLTKENDLKTPIAEDDDGGNALNARITFSFSEKGNYYLFVADVFESRGSVSVLITRRDAGRAANAPNEQVGR